MIYPIGLGTKEDLDAKWYVPDGGEFGYNRGTYFHSGTDLNLKTGGNTDLGEPIRAIVSGKLVYYHFASHPTTNFGRHNVYRIDGPWGTRWIGSCHCQDKDFMGVVKDVAEGDLIARIGNSGTKYSHLHLKCFKVDPSGLDKGIDTVAKTKIQLDTWFEDPLSFIEKWINFETEQNMPNWLRTMYLELGIDIAKPEGEIRDRVQTVIDGYKRYEELEEKVDKLQKELEASNAEVGGLEKRLQTIEQDRGEAEKQITILQREVRARDKELEELQRKIEGKVIITEDEYQRLQEKKVLTKNTTWELIKEIFSRIFKGKR